jgi:phosphate transport system substrate-binding protein
MVLTLAVLMSGLLSVSPAAAEKDQTSEKPVAKLQIEGSTTLGPLCLAFAEVLKQEGIVLEVKATGSGDGAAALIDGRCDVAAMSRFMKASEFQKAVDKEVLPVAHVVAMDGICVVVHPSNPVKSLTLDQMRKIYTGKITNWKQVGGPDKEVHVITRDSSSGTFGFFSKSVLKGDKIVESAESVSGQTPMHRRVSATQNAIGYVGLAVLDDKLKAVKVEGVLPTRRTVATGKFPISRPLFLFTDGYPAAGSPLHRLVTFHLSLKGQNVIAAKKYVPVTDY